MIPLCHGEELAASVAKNLDAYNVVWHLSRKDSTESMPCGGYDIGLNVWVENGDLLFYMSRSGTFEENNSMLKLGRVRIKLTPNPFAAGGTFRQELKLKEGCVEIQGTAGSASATVKLWVEVARPVVHVDVHSEQPVNLESWYETWRTEDHPLSVQERMTPQFEFYVRGLHNAEMASKVYWGHGGAMFTEQSSNYGLPIGQIYESHWSHRGLGPRPDADIGFLKNGFCCDLYDGVLEFCQMILESQSYAGQDISRYLQLINSCVAFQDEHFRYENKKRTGQELDANGHLVLFPSSGVETYKQARNPANVIAGLRVVLTSLLALPNTYGTAKDRANWGRV
jgi:hypothetical protein